MSPKELKRISKFLSLVLRHRPETIGVVLDDAGWTLVEELLSAMRRSGRGISREELDAVVRENDKQRFAFDETGLLIRAQQGHSRPVELGYKPAVPPDVLFHGTPRQFVEAIRAGGLQKQSRHHVHLHAGEETATAVGRRRGEPVVLTVDALRMHRDGFAFFVTPNAVWLTDHVPPEYLQIPPVSSG